MNDDQRRQVRENAQYLRAVRPIDPGEIHEYVEGQPHPAAVRQVLREEALDLGLLERPDGRFEPVADEPLDPAFDGVERLPDDHARRLEDLLVERFGPDWHRGASGDRLREAIRRLKADYYRGRPVEYDETVALGYAIYHLPDYYAAVQYVLDELGRQGLLASRLRVLDVGAGVGGPALGLADYVGDGALVEYHGVEPSAAADVLAVMLAGTGPNVHPSIHRTTAEAFDPSSPLGDGGPGDGDAGGDEDGGGDASAEDAGGDASAEDAGGDEDAGSSGADTSAEDAAGDTSAEDTGGDASAEDTGGDASKGSAGYDLVLFANVSSELDDPEATLRRYAGHLAPDGALVAIAPADLETSTGLRELERALDEELTVFSPTLRLWPDVSPSDEGWSFAVQPDLAVPPFQRKLAEEAEDPDEFVNVDVQYSHAVLRPDGRRRLDVRGDPERFARMADAEAYVTERVDLLGVKLSHDLSEGGNPLFKVSDGSESVSHFAVLARETSLNRALREAEYGDVLVFESVLALWNDDEAAYNLVVDDETVVDLVPAP